VNYYQLDWETQHFLSTHPLNKYFKQSCNRKSDRDKLEQMLAKLLLLWRSEARRKNDIYCRIDTLVMDGACEES
jgi:hypothetical protein